MLQRSLGISSGAGELVETWIDGARFLAHLVVDSEQAELRSTRSIGAVTSTAALHALWNLPPTPVKVGTLSELDVETLSGLPLGLVELAQSGLMARCYRPIGEVRMLATASSSLWPGVRRAMAIPPIFERACVWLSSPAEPFPATESIAAARRSGTGIVRFAGEQAQVVVPLRRRIAGVPAVYRWWVAELAYESKLNQAQIAQAAS